MRHRPDGISYMGLQETKLSKRQEVAFPHPHSKRLFYAARRVCPGTPTTFLRVSLPSPLFLPTLYPQAVPENSIVLHLDLLSWPWAVSLDVCCFHHLSLFFNPTLEPVNCLYNYTLRPKTFDVREEVWFFSSLQEWYIIRGENFKHLRRPLEKNLSMMQHFPKLILQKSSPLKLSGEIF